MANIKLDKYILGESLIKNIQGLGEEIRLDLSLLENNNYKYGKVYGIVTTTDNTPIEGAIITIFDTNYNPVLHSFSDLNGKYNIYNVPPSSGYNIVSNAQNYKIKQGLQFPILLEEYVERNFVLEEDISDTLGTIAGDVLALSTGQPIAGAAVYLFKLDANNIQSLEAVAFTNSSGQYAFRGLQQGNYQVRVRALGYSGNYAVGDIIQPGQILNMVINLYNETNLSVGTVSGIIVDSNNNPISNADVILYLVSENNVLRTYSNTVNAPNETLTPIASTKTVSSGVYLFANVPPGKYKVKSNKSEILSINV